MLAWRHMFRTYSHKAGLVQYAGGDSCSDASVSIARMASSNCFMSRSQLRVFHTRTADIRASVEVHAKSAVAEVVSADQACVECWKLLVLLSSSFLYVGLLGIVSLSQPT